MSKFITGKALSETIYNIIWEAELQLLIVSPYIKLDDYFKRLFDRHLSNPKIQITIIFGKNEGQVNKSFAKADLDYFKQFLNVSIVYAPNLHAKYYANESMGMLTSINLYDYSFMNNIEFGVVYENRLLSRLSKNTDEDAWHTCMDIADANELVYIKRPIFQKRLFGKDYMSSKVLIDTTDNLYQGHNTNKTLLKLSDFKDELDYDAEYKSRPLREEVDQTPKPSRAEFETRRKEPSRENIPSSNANLSLSQHLQNIRENKNKEEESFGLAYCIRTRASIPFNPKQPLCQQAFRAWNQFGNEDYPEKYCHFSGEPSNGETSVSRPILYKNWKKAKQAYGF